MILVLLVELYGLYWNCVVWLQQYVAATRTSGSGTKTDVSKGTAGVTSTCGRRCPRLTPQLGVCQTELSTLHAVLHAPAHTETNKSEYKSAPQLHLCMTFPLYNCTSLHAPSDVLVPPEALDVLRRVHTTRLLRRRRRGSAEGFAAAATAGSG